MKKRFLSFLLVLCMVLTLVPVFSTQANAATYYANGKAFPNSKFTADGSNPYCNDGIAVGSGKHYCCFAYAMAAYNYIWDTTFSKYGDAGKKNDMLRNLSASERTTTVAHLKAFLAEAKAGANVRFTSSSSEASDPYLTGDDEGHSMIFLGLDSGNTGAYFLEGNWDNQGRSRIHLHTWSSLSSRGYVKYIIWPSAPAYSGGVPAAPTIKSAEGASTTSIKVTWGKVNSATSYRVDRRKASDEGYSTIETGITGTTYTDTGLEAGTKYWYRVYAVNSAGTSARSESFYGQTLVMVDLNAYVNDTKIGKLTNYGTADVYIDGTRVADDCNDYYVANKIGAKYEIKDVASLDGYNFTGFNSGSFSGTVGASGVDIQLKFEAESDEVTVADGVYYLVSAVDDSKVIGVADQSTANRANLELQTLTNQDTQYFRVYRDGDYYRLKSVFSGKVMDVSSGSREPKTNLQQFDASSKDDKVNQQFRFLDAGDGYVYIKSAKGNFVDVNGGYSDDGTNVQLYYLNHSDAQRWKFVRIQKVDCYQNDSGKNYLFGSDFSALNSEYWYSRDTSVSTLSVDSTNQHNGYNSLKIVNESAGASGKDLGIKTQTSPSKSHNFYMGDEKEMVLSFWAKSSQSGTKFYFRWGFESEYRSVTLTTDWQYYTVRMDKTTDYNNYMHPYIDRAGTVWLAEMQLEDGTEASAFEPESGMPQTYSVLYGQTYSVLTDESRDDYRFDGWYTSKTGGTKVTADTNVMDGDLVLYARWAKAQSVPVITTQPTDVIGEVGAYATFQVEASGDGLTYQWQYSDDDGASWVNSKSTAETATCKITAARDGRLYRCVVTDQHGNSVTSDTAKLTAAKPAAITTQPKAASGAVGDTVTFAVKATGDGLTYQWQYKDVGGSWKNSASTTAAANCAVTAARDGRLYRCKVTDRYGNTVTSGTAKLTVEAAITTQPKDYTGAAGDKATFTVKATGADLSYQWQYSDNNGKTWTDSKSTEASATCAITAARDGRLYRCVVTSANGTSVTSDAAKVIVKTALTITQQPKSFTGAAGASATFTVKATGDGLQYQWYYSDDNGKTWTKSSSATATATCKITAARDGRLYRCTITDQHGDTITSSSARLLVG